MDEFKGKVAVITGGASGIGEATARLFVAEGGRVLIADMQAARGQALADDLGEAARFVHCEVRQEDQVRAAVDAAVEAWGRLDCMFNNAGIAGPIGSIESVNAKDFDEAIGVLLRGVFLGIKHAAPIMKRQGSGSIVNTASVAGLRTGYGNHIYSAAKAGVIQLTRSVAMELGESGVRVNCICPGFIPTPMIGRARGLSIAEADRKLDTIRESFTLAQPLRGPGDPTDIAKAALWLASDDSSFVNGHALVVDGGVTGGRTWSDYQDAITGIRKTLCLEPDKCDEEDGRG